LSLPGSQPTLGRLRKLACPAIHDEVQRTPKVHMDHRVTPHPSRLQPTWALFMPISGKPEIGRFAICAAAR
jgi:hypothetical protein